MKKGVEYTGVVTKIAFPNKGEVDCGEDGIASVKGTLPGQKVKFVVSKKRSGKAQGRLKEISWKNRGRNKVGWEKWEWEKGSWKERS